MNWLQGVLGNVYAFWSGLATPLYDQGYIEGYEDGQEDGHAHGACQHTHPFDASLKALAKSDDWEIRLGGYY